MEPRNLPKPNSSVAGCGTLSNSSSSSKTKPCLEPWNLPNLYLEPVYLWTSGSFTCNLEPRNFTWTLTENLRNSWGFYLESLLEAWNLPKLYLRSFASGTFTWNPCSEPRNLLEPFMIGTLTWNSEPAGTFTWYPNTWNFGTFLLETPKPAGTFTWNLRNLTWNPYLEPRNVPEPLLGTLTQNLGTCRNLYSEHLLGTSEPAGTFTWNLLLGALTWNLGTCRNLYLEPSLGTSEPARTWWDDCPRVPQGFVWLGPQSFQLLGNYY